MKKFLIILTFIMFSALFISCDIVIGNRNDLSIKLSNPSSYDELFDFYNDEQLSNQMHISLPSIDRDMGIFTETVMFSANDSSKKPIEPNYSDTNTQVAGVQEGDYIKTNGYYIYVYSENSINIIKASGKDTKLVSTIKLYEYETYQYFREMYLYDDVLTLIFSGYTCHKEFFDSDFYYYSYWNPITVQMHYDVSNPEEPVLMSTLAQDGYYLSSRMIENYLYITALKSIFYYYCLDDKEFLYPAIYLNEERIVLDLEDILIYPCFSTYQYFIITGVNVKSPEQFISNKATIGGWGDMYATTQHLYVIFTANVYFNYSKKNVSVGDQVTNKSVIVKMELKKGDIDVKSVGLVEGNIKDQFCLDEYEGNLRITSLVWTYEYQEYEYKRYNYYIDEDGLYKYDINDYEIVTYLWLRNVELYSKVTVLDKNLKYLGSIGKLGENENLQSCRYIEDRVYLVTFRVTDPLYVVDLSNPKDPTLLDELKIPGFSVYLHPFGKDMLFGFGYEADDNGIRTGLKLSMFSIKDDELIELDKYVLPYINTNNEYKYYYSELTTNHKALLIDYDMNIIGIPIYYYSYSYTSGNYKSTTGESFMIFTYDDNGFKLDVELSTFEPNNTYYYSSNIRGIYIDEYLYVSNYNGIMVYNLEDYEYVVSTYYHQKNGK